MENLDIATEQLNKAKARLAELVANKTRLENESERLQTLLQATESEVYASIKERREFIEGGGDVFDQRAKKLRKEEQVNAALIDDLKFAIETNRNASEAMLFDLSSAHDKALGNRNVLVRAMIANLLAKVLENPPTELLKVCHLATQAHFEEGSSFFLATLSVDEKVSYENAFLKKMRELLSNDLSSLISFESNKALLSDDERALLSIHVLKDKLSPAQAHIIKSSKNKTLVRSAFHDMYPEYLGGR